MNNHNFEFKSYTPTPNDPYMLGIAKVKLYGKVIANFKEVKTKDGSGTFFCTANYTSTDASGEKKYMPCVMLDSRDDEQDLLDFIRDNVNRLKAQRSAVAQEQPNVQSGQYYPHGMAKTTAPMPDGMSGMQTSEAAQNNDLPF